MGLEDYSDLLVDSDRFPDRMPVVTEILVRRRCGTCNFYGACQEAGVRENSDACQMYEPARTGD